MRAIEWKDVKEGEIFRRNGVHYTKIGNRAMVDYSDRFGPDALGYVERPITFGELKNGQKFKSLEIIPHLTFIKTRTIDSGQNSVCIDDPERGSKYGVQGRFEKWNCDDMVEVVE